MARHYTAQGYKVRYQRPAELRTFNYTTAEFGPFQFSWLFSAPLHFTPWGRRENLFLTNFSLN